MEFWKVIEKMNFNGRGYEKAGRWLVEDSGLTFSEIKQVRDMANRKVSLLYKQFCDDFRGSDDGFSDVLWQVVANGYEAFKQITIIELQDMYDEMRYTESFAYAFHAVSEIEDEQFRANRFLKLKKAEQHLEDIRKGFGGGFVTKLVAAFDHADSNNKKKLAKGFPELFELIVDDWYKD